MFGTHPEIETIRLARIEGDELVAREAEIRLLRALLDDALCPSVGPHERQSLARQLRFARRGGDAMSGARLTPAALDLARTRAIADVAALTRVAAIYSRRGQEREAVFWNEAAKTAAVLAELARSYVARATITTEAR